MSKDKALVIARGIWSDAGCKEKLHAEAAKNRAAAEQYACRFMTFVSLGRGLGWYNIKANGRTWEEALEQLRARFPPKE